MNEVSQKQCPQGSRPYEVKAGDTLYDIAQRHNTTVNDILAINPQLDPNMLEIGEVICIPRREAPPVCPGGRRYTIKAGDTLGNIAVRFNTTVDEILRLNPGIDPRSLRVAQIICIPAAAPSSRCPEDTTPYIVKQGDTLYVMSQRFGVRMDDILSANRGINPDRLIIGERICIPRAGIMHTERQQPSAYMSDEEPTLYSMENEVED